MRKILNDSKSVLDSFFVFLLHPNGQKEKKRSFISYVISFIIVSLFALLFQILILFLLTQLGFSSIAKDGPMPTTSFQIIFIGMLIAPIFEELIFRYPLKYTQNGLFIGLLSLSIMNLLTRNSLNNLSIPIIIKSGIVFLIAIVLYFLTRNKKINTLFQKFWEHRLAIIVYVFSIYFAIGHFGLPFQGANWLFLPFVVFPSFVFALYQSFLRLKIGFNYCVFIHIGYNFTIGLPLIFESIKS